MGKPKKSEYKPSEVEKINASIALAEKDYFKKEFLPKQKEFVERVEIEADSLVDRAEGVAVADTMQALTTNPNRRAVESVDAQADMASAGTDQLLQGTTQGVQAGLSDQITGMKFTNKMASDTQAGLSLASKIATTDTLNRAKARRIRDAGSIGMFTTLGKQAGQNVGQYRAANIYNEMAEQEDRINVSDNPFDIIFGRSIGKGTPT